MNLGNRTTGQAQPLWVVSSCPVGLWDLSEVPPLSLRSPGTLTHAAGGLPAPHRFLSRAAVNMVPAIPRGASEGPCRPQGCLRGSRLSPGVPHRVPAVPADAALPKVPLVGAQQPRQLPRALPEPQAQAAADAVAVEQQRAGPAAPAGGQLPRPIPEVRAARTCSVAQNHRGVGLGGTSGVTQCR